MKKLDKFKSNKLDSKEIKNVKGGNPIALGITIAGAAIYVYNNWEDFVKGFKAA